MRNKIAAFINKNRQFIPVMSTALLAVLAYTIGAIFYPGMRNPQVFFNIFRNNSFLLISAVGMTLVILTGGIDLSVSGMIALTTVSTAALLREGVDSWLVFLLMLLMGSLLGLIMGSIIAFLKVQPFIATLAGMWITRGLCFFISDDAISISNRTIEQISRIRIYIPGVTEAFEVAGKIPPYVSISVAVAFIIYISGIYISRYTRFGRTVYAIGGNEGRNEQSARLMGLPVTTTKVLVYTINGFCSGLAGIFFAVFVTSGHGLYATGLEMDVIASVVMGGTMLTGGSGYVFGTIFGVFILGLTQTLIQFNGSLSSWWTKVVIGVLTLIFIGVQSLLKQSKGGRRKGRALSGQALADHRKKRLITIGIIAGFAVMIGIILLAPKLGNQDGTQTTAQSGKCELQVFRQEQVPALIESGATIVYERNGGPNCVDELFAIYPDGRITGTNGKTDIEKQITIPDYELLLAGLVDNGWFTDELYDTWHTPCRQCYGYYLTVIKDGQVKTVKGVDGGTDAPAIYWQIISLVKGAVPKFDVSE
jgi:galactofuranose transport system permease protein